MWDWNWLCSEVTGLSWHIPGQNLCSVLSDYIKQVENISVAKQSANHSDYSSVIQIPKYPDLFSGQDWVELNVFLEDTLYCQISFNFRRFSSSE